MRTLSVPPGDTPTVVPPGGGRRVVVLARDGAELDSVARTLRTWREAGHTTVLVWREGEPGEGLRSFKARRQVVPAALPRSPRAIVGGLRDGSLQRRVRERGTLAGDLRADARAVAELGRADAVLLVGDVAEEPGEDLLGVLDEAGTPLVPGPEPRWWTDLGTTWPTLDDLLARADLDAGDVEGLRRRIDLLGTGVPPARQDLLARVVAARHREGDHEAALDLAGHLTWEEGDFAQVHRRGLAALVRTSAAGEEDPDLRASAAGLLQEADAALARDDLDRVADVTNLALELLFHRELHADGLSSPLVEDPDGFLAGWRASRVGQLLGSATPQEPAVRDTRPAGGPPRVVVSPGTFPKFVAPVVEALAQAAEVEELDLSARVDLRWLGVSRDLVERRLLHALGRPAGLDLELVEELERADVLFADWGDRAAVELVMSLPADRSATVRIHSMDALSAWVHLVDWSRVGDLVLVSEHLREVVRRVLGDRLRHTRLHVVPNVVDLSRFGTEKTEGHRRRLLMTGWAQRVKDPLWALEILAALRADDPGWRLTLLGADFLLNPVVSTQDYAREFWARMVQDDVREAVDVVGFTDDIGAVLADAGFILSTSRRESFGLGLVEGALSGCVPVVRDWPVFAAVGGARGLFPQDWVVASVEEAVERIRATCDEPAWTQASRSAVAEAQQRFAVDSAQEQLRQIVLGQRLTG